MARYIDLDKAIQDVESVGAYYSEGEQVKEQCLFELKEQPIADVVPRSEVERLEKELAKCYEELDKSTDFYCSFTQSKIQNCPIQDEVEKAKQEVAREIFKQAFDYPTLADWYISSVDDRDTPVWTDEHIEELLNDFYVIPKEIADGYKV